MDKQRKQKFFDFIERARPSATNYRRFQLNQTIPQRLADAIKEVIGVDVCDYKNEIYEDIVRHIEKRRGQSGTSDHSISDMHKLERIDKFLSDFDSTRSGNGNPRFKNSNHTKTKTIEIIKDFGEEQGHLIEAVPISNKKS